MAMADADSGGGGSGRVPLRGEGSQRPGILRGGGRGAGRGAGRGGLGLQRGAGSRFNVPVSTASTVSTASISSISSTASTIESRKSRLPFRGMKREKSVKFRHKVKAELCGIQREMERTLGDSKHDGQDEREPSAKGFHNLGSRHKARKELREMQRQIDRMHLDDDAEAEEGELVGALVGAKDGKDDKDDKDGKDGKDGKDSELISSLLETNRRNLDTIQHWQTQLSVASSQNESAKVELDVWKYKHEAMKSENLELIQRMAIKAQDQLRSHSEMTKAEVEDWKGKYAQLGQLYDVLVEKVGALADENVDLLVKCHRLEEDDIKSKEEIANLEGIQEECDVLHQSMEEAVQLASGMSKNMVNYVNDHQAVVQDYEQKLASLNDRLDQAALSKEKSDAAVNALMGQNGVLRAQFQEAAEYYRQNSSTLKK